MKWLSNPADAYASSTKLVFKRDEDALEIELHHAGDYTIAEHVHDDGFYAAYFNLPEESNDDYIVLTQRDTMENCVTLCQLHYNESLKSHND